MATPASPDLHRENLAKICRMCDEPLKDMDTRKPIPKQRFRSELSQCARINIDTDNNDIHPTSLCHGCERRIGRWKQKHGKKRIENRPIFIDFSPPDFQAHVDGECRACNRFPPSETEQDQEASNFVVAAEAVGKSYGFVKWEDEEGNHIFIILDKGLSVSRAVTIHPDTSWKILILDHTVHPSTVPNHLEEADLQELFKWAVKPFCVGSSDFPTLFNMDFENSRFKRDTKFTIIHNNELINDTIRSRTCLGYRSDKAVRCPSCSKYRTDLYSKVNEQKNRRTQVGDLSSHMRNDLMSKETLTQKTKNLKKENIALKRHIDVLKGRICQIIEHESVSVDPEHSAQLTETVNNNSTYMEGILQEGSAERLLWDQQKEYLMKKDARQMRWHPTIIKWCIALYEKSPIAYKTIRKSNFLKLPHHTTLFKYTHFTEARSGINPDILKEIVKEAKFDSCNQIERNVSLLIDEMKIKNNLVYSQRSGKIWGFTEMGDLNEEIARFQRQMNEEDDPPVASYVLVIMIRGIFSSLKKAIAWYPCTGFNGNQLFHTVWDVVKKVEFAGFYVRAFVSDGASPNRKFYSLHGNRGSPQHPTYCTPNPVDLSRNIYFICDVPHLLKTTRNCWENSGWNSKSRNMMFRGKEISWKHLVDLYEWDIGLSKESPGLRLLHKLTPDHVHLTPSLRMRVYLAAQVLSSSVAHAMALQTRENDQATNHVRNETESTAHFISYMDTFFDIMNISNKFDGTRKRKGALAPFTSMDDPRFQWLTNDFLGFLDEWEGEGDKVVPKLKADEKRRLTLSPQTLEGLRITVYSFVELAPILLSEEGAEYILTEKFSQDPLEEYFSKHRGRGGFNDNPSSFTFGHQFNSLFVSSSASVRATLGMTRNMNREEDASSSIISNDPLPKRKTSSKKDEL